MLNTPFTPWPQFSEEERNAVSDVLASGRVNYWTGNECRQFEREYAEWVGTDSHIEVALDGSHVNITVVSSAFTAKSFSLR